MTIPAGPPLLGRGPIETIPLAVSRMTERMHMSMGGVSASAVALLLVVGCHKAMAPPIQRTYWPQWAPKIIAVAPAINQSGSDDFDSVRVADLAASELGNFEGVRVVGVNQVMAAMVNRNMQWLRSPEDAMAIGRDLGVDGVLVFAITEYDPYDPPVVGLTMQLYATNGPSLSGGDPVQASRMPAPPETEQAVQTSGLPWAEIQRVFNASHRRVVADVKEYARVREDDLGPYGWKRNIVSQELYLRFCFYSAIGELLSMPVGLAAASPVNTG